jgi:uncharacterized protein
MSTQGKNLQRCALLVFAKVPALGKVKTRLAAEIGDEQALSIYKKLLFYTFDLADELPCYTLACLTSEDEITLESIPFDGFYAQKANVDLGGKMSDAIAYSLARGFERVVVIGTDCAELNAQILEEAFVALLTRDVVIGPAKDGGYYLIGMNKTHHKLFEGINWSTEKVLDQTKTALTKLNLSFTLLPILSDIDTLADLEACKNPLIRKR